MVDIFKIFIGDYFKFRTIKMTDLSQFWKSSLQDFKPDFPRNDALLSMKIITNINSSSINPFKYQTSWGLNEDGYSLWEKTCLKNLLMQIIHSSKLHKCCIIISASGWTKCKQPWYCWKKSAFQHHSLWFHHVHYALHSSSHIIHCTSEKMKNIWWRMQGKVDITYPSLFQSYVSSFHGKWAQKTKKNWQP